MTYKDGYTGKQIMVLIFTYFVYLPKIAEENQQSTTTNKIFLQHYLKDHKLWIQKEFWDSAFIESVFEESKQHSKGQVDTIIKGIGINF
jgi:hypothetical protein